jgi:hypothetical protein
LFIKPLGGLGINLRFELLAFLNSFGIDTVEVKTVEGYATPSAPVKRRMEVAGSP